MGLTRAEKIKFVRATVAEFKPVVSERVRLERQMRHESAELSEADVLIHDLRQSAFETMLESLVPRELDELFEVVRGPWRPTPRRLRNCFASWRLAWWAASSSAFCSSFSTIDSAADRPSRARAAICE